jgi:hypothetical protein
VWDFGIPFQEIQQLTGGNGFKAQNSGALVTNAELIGGNILFGSLSRVPFSAMLWNIISTTTVGHARVR